MLVSQIYARILDPDSEGQKTDANDCTVIDSKVVVGSSQAWILASHSSDASSIVEPRDERWTALDSAVEPFEIQVQLTAPLLLRVEVADRRGHRVAGASVSAYATRGREAELFVGREVQHSLPRDLLAPIGITDPSGATLLSRSRAIAYEVVACKLGFSESSLYLDPTLTSIDRVTITLDAFVAAGIKVPEFDGEAPTIGSYSEREGLGDGINGVRRADLDNATQRRLVKSVEGRIGIINIQWHFGIESDPSSYPISVPIGFRALPCDPFFKGDLKFKLLEEIAASDVLCPPETRCERLEDVTTRFIDENSNPTLPDDAL